MCELLLTTRVGRWDGVWQNIILWHFLKDELGRVGRELLNIQTNDIHKSFLVSKTNNFQNQLVIDYLKSLFNVIFRINQSLTT